MTETDFIASLAEFTTRTPETLTFTDELEAVGVDSIGIFEFTMKVEEELGRPVEFTDRIATVQDLYDCVEAAT